MFEFKITKRRKRRARRRRMRTEKKWRILRIIMALLLSISILGFIMGVFIISDTDYVWAERYGIIFSCTFVGFFMVLALNTNLASHWIQDRLNERMWIENGVIYHFVQTAFAAGWNIRNADETARVFEYDIASIREPKYDPKSGRIEFLVDGRWTYYTDYSKKRIGEVGELRGAHSVFYDYMKPSLYEYLSENGVAFELTTLDFKIRDPYI